MIPQRGLFLLFVLFSLLQPLILAQTSSDTPSTPLTSDPSRGYTWLANYSISHPLTLSDQAYTILALLGEGGKEQIIANLKQKLQDAEDRQNSCWPQQRCKVRESALAVLALTKTGTPQDKEIKKLKAQSLATLRTSGEWRVQIDAPSNGTCTLTWGTSQKKDFELRGSAILGTSRKFYINIATDLPGGTTFLATPNNNLTVDCTQLSGTITLSLVYAKSATELYIVQSFPNTAKTAMTIQNACLPDSYSGTTCAYDATLEATWALIEAGEPVDTLGTLPYLYSTIGNDDTQRAYLARLLSIAGRTPTSLLEQLAKNQRSDGGWKAGDIFTTSLAVLAFTPSAGSYQDNLGSGKLFLQKHQANDGSWKQTVRDTAMALIALRGDINGATVTTTPSTRIPGVREVCDNAEDDDGNGFRDCADVDVCGKEKICHCDNLQKDLDEEGIDCGGADCPACTKEDKETTPSAILPPPEDMRDKEPSRPSTGVCAQDTDCDADEACVSGTCKKKEKTNTGLIILLIVLALLLAGGVLFYLQFVRTGKIDLKALFKRSKKPTFEEFKRMAEFKPLTPPRPAASPRPSLRPATRPRPARSSEDEALERSLKEAEKLLHKK